MSIPAPLRGCQHIGLILDIREHFFRELRRGVCEYALPRQPWVLRGISRSPANVRKFLDWKPAGLILALEDEEMTRAWTGLDVPVVVVGFRYLAEGIPMVGVEDAAVGRMAVDEFVSRGYHQLAFLGSASDVYSRERQSGFLARAEELGRSCISRLGITQDPGEDLPLGHWLRSLPPGTGLFAADDRWGVRASEVARELGLTVPHDLAILAVGNDDICSMTHPRLSSIVLPGRKVGFEAARMLESLIRGDVPPQQPLLIPPQGILTRASTDTVAVGDPQLAAALRLIQEQANTGIRVEQVARAAGLNRRSLELRFRRLLGRSPLQEIRRIRIDRVRQLLMETDLTLEQIADLTGFPNSQRMAVVFREVQGQSPGAFRRLFRRSAPAT